MAKSKNSAWAPGGFAGIPRRIMEHEDYRTLPANAVKLLNVLTYQYRGKNNGDLTASFSVLKAWGFVSKETLSRATKALLSRRVAVVYGPIVHRDPLSR